MSPAWAWIAGSNPTSHSLAEEDWLLQISSLGNLLLNN